PVRTLYFITHAAPGGRLLFGFGEKEVSAAVVANKLKDAIAAENAPQHVDFRGCTVGAAPKAMDQIRSSLGAKSAVAGNCFAVIRRSKPIRIDGKAITSESQITDRNRDEFRRLLESTLGKFPRGETDCVLNKSEKGFFAAGGKFISLFYN